MNADNLVGRTVAGYHLAEYIGEGGTATVYRAGTPSRARSRFCGLAWRRILTVVRKVSRGRVRRPRPAPQHLQTRLRRHRRVAPRPRAGAGRAVGGVHQPPGQLAPPWWPPSSAARGRVTSAHKAGIIHRDLKPGSTSCTIPPPDGQAAGFRSRGALSSARRTPHACRVLRRNAYSMSRPA
jgi:hypothetical protein